MIVIIGIISFIIGVVVGYFIRSNIARFIYWLSGWFS